MGEVRCRGGEAEGDGVVWGQAAAVEAEADLSLEASVC